MNDERGFTAFINRLQMASFGAFVSQNLWIVGSIALTAVDAWLLTRHAIEIRVNDVLEPMKASAAVSVFLAHNTAAEQMRQVGLYLAGILIFGWTGKSVANFFSGKVVRESSREALEGQAKIVEAKARGEATGRPAVTAKTIQHVELKPASPEGHLQEQHEWASGDIREGVL